MSNQSRFETNDEVQEVAYKSKTRNPYKIALIAVIPLFFTAIGLGVWQYVVAEAAAKRITVQSQIIDEANKTNAGLKAMLESNTATNKATIDSLNEESNGKIEAFAKQVATCDAIKRRIGAK